MEGLLSLLVLVVLAVPVLLVVALVSVNGLKRRVGELEVEVATLKSAAFTDGAAAQATRARAERPQAGQVPPGEGREAANAAADGLARDSRATDATGRPLAADVAPATHDAELARDRVDAGLASGPSRPAITAADLSGTQSA